METSNLRGHVQVAASNRATFSNANIGDFVIYTSSNSQKILIGTVQNSPAALTVTSNMVDVSGDLNFSGALRQGGAPFQSSRWSSNATGGIFISSNVGIGTSNTAGYALNVAGNMNFTGALTQGGAAFQTSRWSSNATGIHVMSNVGVGTSNLAGAGLTLAGNLYMGGTDLFIGASNNRIVFGSVLEASNLVVPGALNFMDIELSANDGSRNANIVTQVNPVGYSNGATGTVLSVSDTTQNFVFRAGATEVARVGGNGRIGVGNTNPAYTLDVTGDVNFTGTLRQNGNSFQTSRWSSSATGVSVTSNVGIQGPAVANYALSVNGNTEVAGHIHARTNNTHDLGTAAARFSNVHASSLMLGGGAASITSSNSNILFNGSVQVPGALSFRGIEIVESSGAQANISTLVTAIPGYSNTATGTILTGDGAERLRVHSNVNISTHLVPTANEVYDLGTSNMRFRDLYMSGNTIFMGSNYSIGVDSNTDTLTLLDRRSNIPARMRAREVVLTGTGDRQKVLRLDPASGMLKSVDRYATTGVEIDDPVTFNSQLPRNLVAAVRASAADNTWRGITWSPQLRLFVAVASSGTGNRIMTSSDGVTWTTQISPENHDWASVCWSPERAIFVAVAEAGTSAGNRVMTSSDGITWTLRATPIDNGWNSVCWSPERALFVAVSWSGSNDRVMTSSDGSTWTLQTSIPVNNWVSVCWSPQQMRFVAVANVGANTTTLIMTSENGTTWTARTSPTNSTGWYSVCWSAERGLFVAVSLAGTGTRVMTSLDGITWTLRSTPMDNSWISICWASECGLFIAVAISGTGDRIMTSPDGITWTLRTSPADNNWRGICWSPTLGMFAAVSVTGTGNRVMTIKYDPDTTLAPLTVRGGITNASVVATARATPDRNYLSICWSPERSLFVAVGHTGTGNRVMTSPDGITWTSRASAADCGWHSVCWSKEKNLFVAVAFEGLINNRVMTSPDGITWTIRSSPAGDWITVCWSPERGIFVAVGNGTNYVMTSENGIDWTARTPAVNNSWRSVCWSKELNIFVAVANSGTGNRVMTSPNGFNWTSGTSAADNSWNSVCWSAERKLFVAVSYDGNGNRVMTSPDGTTWTSRASAADNIWYNVCWSAELGIFMAVSGGGANNRIMTSPDGINWTTRRSSDSNNWYGICWSPQLGIFVAVSFSSSTSNRAMTIEVGQTAFVDSLAVGNEIYASQNHRALSVGNNRFVVDGTGNVSVGKDVPAATARLDINVAYRHPPMSLPDSIGYSAIASSQHATGHPVPNAFDYDNATRWATIADAYNLTTGVYQRTPATTTTASGTSYSGEWIQVHLPFARVSTGMTYRGNGLRRFVIAGSQDGNTWTSLLVRNLAGDPALISNMTHFIGFSNTQPYFIYRLIIIEGVTGHMAGSGGGFDVHDLRFLELPPNNCALRIGNASGGDGVTVDYEGNMGVATSNELDGARLVVEKSDGTNAHTGAYIVIKNHNESQRIHGTVMTAGGILFSSFRDVYRTKAAYTSGITYETTGFDNTHTQSALVFRTSGATAAGLQHQYLPTERARFTTGGNFRPGADNTYSLGESSFKWNVIYANTGTINQSDTRSKLDFGSTFGLDFVNALEPVSYRYKHGKTVFDEVEDGVEEVPAVIDEQGNEVTPATTRPKYKLVERKVEGVRRHHGLKAQQVKQVLEAQELGDFAGWVLDDLNDPESQQGLRYDQFIAPLIQAVKELTAKNAVLETRIAALESR